MASVAIFTLIILAFPVFASLKWHKEFGISFLISCIGISLINFAIGDYSCNIRTAF